jgi:hypothetical protein
MAPSNSKSVLEASRTPRQQSCANINAVAGAMAQSRKVIANSKKLLERSQGLTQKTADQQMIIIDRDARVHFLAATFLHSVRN